MLHMRQESSAFRITLLSHWQVSLPHPYRCTLSCSLSPLPSLYLSCGHSLITSLVPDRVHVGPLPWAAWSKTLSEVLQREPKPAHDRSRMWLIIAEMWEDRMNRSSFCPLQWTVTLTLGALWSQTSVEKAYLLFSYWRQFFITASCQVLAMPVGQACKSFLVTLLTEEMIPSASKFIWAWDCPQANYLTVGLFGRGTLLFSAILFQRWLFFFPSCLPECLDKYLLFWAGPANVLQ